jgi:nucleotide-binding universal stress UspA family protein
MRTDTLTAPRERHERTRGFGGPVTSKPPEPTTGGGRTQTGGVIVAFNGSPAARDALRLGIRLARSSRAELVVACVFPPESLAGLTFDPRATRIAAGDHRIFVRQDADAVLAEARAAVPDDLVVRCRAIECQSIANGLRHLALAEAAKTIVLGAAHRGLAARLLHRGIARSLMRHPPCPVAVAHSNRRDQRAASVDPCVREDAASYLPSAQSDQGANSDRQRHR